MRLFAAIEINDAWRLTLAELEPLLRSADCKSSIVPNHHLHLTLKFIGESDEGLLGPIKIALMRAASAATPFKLHLETLGAFPELGNPRVIWAGAGGDLPLIRRLHQSIESELRDLGIEPEDRPYTPHITLARIKGGVFDRRLLQAHALKSHELQVKNVTLFESRLNNQGSEYHALERYPLK